jgi:hypothetical protein
MPPAPAPRSCPRSGSSSQRRRSRPRARRHYRPVVLTLRPTTSRAPPCLEAHSTTPSIVSGKRRLFLFVGQVSRPRDWLKMKQPGLRRGDAGNGGGLGALTTVNRPWPTNGASPPRRDLSRSGSARLGRSQKDGLPCPSRGKALHAVQGHRLALEGGSLIAAPFSSGSGNGRHDAPCFARRPLIVLRRLRLELGSRCFGFGLFCARRSCHCRLSQEPLALTWAS